MTPRTDDKDVKKTLPWSIHGGATAVLRKVFMRSGMFKQGCIYTVKHLNIPTRLKSPGNMAGVLKEEVPPGGRGHLP